MTIKQRKSLPPDLLEDRMLSPEAVAELEGTSVKTVRRDIKAGRLPAVRLSRNRIGIRVSAWRAARSTPA